MRVSVSLKTSTSKVRMRVRASLIAKIRSLSIEAYVHRFVYVGYGITLLSESKGDLFLYQGVYIRVRVRLNPYSHCYSNLVSSVYMTLTDNLTHLCRYQTLGYG